MHRIEISLKSGLPDPRGLGLVRDISDLGISSISGIRVIDVYWLDAGLPAPTVDRICRELLSDCLTQDFWHGTAPRPETASQGLRVVEVAYNPGVMDPVEESVLKGLRDMRVSGVNGVKTGKRYLISGTVTGIELDTVCSRLLVNPIIQHLVTDPLAIFQQNPSYTFSLRQVNLIGLGEADVQRVGARFGFSPDEINAIAAYFRRQKRDPTDAELETLAQTWSEHCVHKTFKGKITLDGRVIDNLLRSTVIRATGSWTGLGVFPFSRTMPV